MEQTEIQTLINRYESTILDYQLKLKSEDYKIIKCAEAKVKDLDMPYDVDELISRRNDYRRLINEAQFEIEKLQNEYDQIQENFGNEKDSI